MPDRIEDAGESLSLRLITPESAADAESVSALLHALVVLIEETGRGLSDDIDVSIRVRAFEEGSLEIPFDVVVLGAATLFEFSPRLSQILSNVKQYVEIRKSLRGRSIEEATDENVVTIDGIVVQGDHNVVNVINNPQVTTAVHEAMIGLDRDPDVSEVRLRNDTTGEEIASINRSEFPYFRYLDDEADQEDHPDRVRGFVQR